MADHGNFIASGDTPAKPSARAISRSNSISQASEGSQTAAEFIKSQLQLEAEAREALPYQFDTCTRPLGALRQSLFSCLTCNPPPASDVEHYKPAGVCYSCSISCHGEHTLVELFTKRNFVCDCGTTRLPSTNPCTLRMNAETGEKGGVHSEEPAADNKYNQNFRNQFCGCKQEYDPHQEKGTMFQCLGLGTVDEGGCGEDWWHPECITGLGRDAYKKYVEASKGSRPNPQGSTILDSIPEEPGPNDIDRNNEARDEDDDDDAPLPPRFPPEDDFESFVCYKCIEAFSWIMKYTGTPGFLPPIFYSYGTDTILDKENGGPNNPSATVSTELPSRKRKASEEDDIVTEGQVPSAIAKRQKSEEIPDSEGPKKLTEASVLSTKTESSTCHFITLPPAPEGRFSLFMKEGFRDHLCRCASCFPALAKHKQLLEEEEIYEPPVSEDGDGQGGGSVGTGSLLDRGEAAFNNMDRVRAIEGAMVYAHLKDKVKAFLQPFAESGQVVGAEDIKAYFETLRGDADAIKQAAGGASSTSKKDDDAHEDDGDARKEQKGY